MPYKRSLIAIIRSISQHSNALECFENNLVVPFYDQLLKIDLEMEGIVNKLNEDEDEDEEE